MYWFNLRACKKKNEQEQETTNHENGPNSVIVVENWHALSLSTFANYVLGFLSSRNQINAETFSGVCLTVIIVKKIEFPIHLCDTKMFEGGHGHFY